MENKSHALAAGLFVVVLMALVIGLSLWLGRDNTAYTRYELSTQERVSGLQMQAAVRYKGVPVGKVVGIEFDSPNAGIRKPRDQVPRSSSCLNGLSSRPALGENEL